MAQNIDSQELALRYLLGTLSDEEASRLDAMYFSDDGQFEELEIAEEELVDRYVRNELSAENARQMRAVLERHPRLRERVEFARILARKVPLPRSEEPVTEPAEAPIPRKKKKRDPNTGWWGMFWGTTAGPAPALRFAFAGSVMLMILATVALLVVWSRFQAESHRLALEQQQRQERERAFESEKARSEELQALLAKAQQENQQKQDRIAELEQQQQQQQQQRPPQQLEGIVASLFILPGTGTRGGSRKEPLFIPPKARVVHLNVDVGAAEGEYESYNASLNDITGPKREIDRWRDLKSFADRGSKYIRLEVPAKSLPRGSYSVQVEGVTSSGQLELLQDYAFSIAR